MKDLEMGDRTLHGYLTVLAEETGDIKPFLLQHLQELMEDAAIYSWRAVRDYHTSYSTLNRVAPHGRILTRRPS